MSLGAEKQEGGHVGSGGVNEGDDAAAADEDSIADLEKNDLSVTD